jgi:hypothetical protein
MGKLSDPRSAMKHVLVQVALQLLVLAGHLALVGALGFGLRTDGGGAVLGAVWKAWVIAGVVWTPLNAWGLYRRRSWARTSTLAYWWMSIPLCCCIPLGVFGIRGLGRPAVRALFDDR